MGRQMGNGIHYLKMAQILLFTILHLGSFAYISSILWRSLNWKLLTLFEVEVAYNLDKLFWRLSSSLCMLSSSDHLYVRLFHKWGDQDIVDKDTWPFTVHKGLYYACISLKVISFSGCLYFPFPTGSLNIASTKCGGWSYYYCIFPISSVPNNAIL